MHTNDYISFFYIYFRSLAVLDISDNPINAIPNYRGTIFNFIPTLQILDTVPTPRRPKHRTTSTYMSIFKQRQDQLSLNIQQPTYSVEVSHKIPVSPSKKSQANEVDLSMTLTTKLNDTITTITNKSIISQDHARKGLYAEPMDDPKQQPEAPLPWKRPPDIIPRPWKGKDPYNYESNSSASKIEKDRLTSKRQNAEKKKNKVNVPEKGWNRMLHDPRNDAQEAPPKPSVSSAVVRVVRRPGHESGKGGMHHSSKNAASTAVVGWSAENKSNQSISSSEVKRSTIRAHSNSPERTSRVRDDGGGKGRSRGRMAEAMDDSKSDSESRYRFRITLGARDQSLNNSSTNLDKSKDASVTSLNNTSIVSSPATRGSTSPLSISRRKRSPGRSPSPVPVSQHLPKDDVLRALPRSGVPPPLTHLLTSSGTAGSFLAEESSGLWTESGERRRGSDRENSPGKWTKSQTPTRPPPLPVEDLVHQATGPEVRRDDWIEELMGAPLSLFEMISNASGSVRVSRDSDGGYSLYDSNRRDGDSLKRSPRHIRSINNKFEMVGNAAPTQSNNISPERLKLIQALMQRKRETMRMLQISREIRADY